jgi:hypothetical protein
LHFNSVYYLDINYMSGLCLCMYLSFSSFSFITLCFPSASFSVPPGIVFKNSRCLTDFRISKTGSILNTGIFCFVSFGFWFLVCFGWYFCFVLKQDVSMEPRLTSHSVLLPQPPECWDYRRAPLHLALSP